MSQQFRIDSEALRDKINTLLPSQARGSINVDLSGTTTIVPIVDLTETAEGSSLRQDLQTSFGINTTFNTVSNTTSTIINTTGYYRLMGNYRSTSASSTTANIQITDGISTTKISEFQASAAGETYVFDYIIILKAGHSCTVTTGTGSRIQIASRQIADISGNLTDPS